MQAVSKTREIETLLAESEWISRLAAKLVGDVHGAQDLAQETHLATLEQGFESGAAPRPWLATVARNGARMMRRSRAARQARETDRAREAAEEMGSSPEELLANLESQELVSRLVRELPAELSDVLLLSFYEGLSSERIAKLRGIPAGTVRWRKKQALEVLRERLDAQHGGDRTAWLAALVPLTTPRWRAGAKLSSGAAGTAGLLATWTAMSLTSKLVSLIVLIAVLAVPFVVGGDGETLQNSEVVVQPAVESRRPVVESTESSTPDVPETEQRRVAVAPTNVAVAEQGGKIITRVRLRIVDSAGRPVAGAKVTPSLSYEMERAHAETFDEIHPLELAALQSQLVQTSGSDGNVSWETDLLHESGLVEFDAVGPNLGVGNLSIALEVGRDVQLDDLVLQRAGAVEGHVRFSDGRSARRLLVVLREGSAPTANDPDAFARWQTELLPNDGEMTRVQKDNSFQITGVAPGEYYVQVNPLDGTPQVASTSFQVNANHTTDGIALWLEVPENGPPQILVLGADGEPLAGAFLQLKGAQFAYSGSVDRDGLWKFLFNGYDKFAGGRVEVSDPSQVHRPKVLDPLPMEGQRIVIQLERAQTLERTLRLVGTNGEAPGEASVEITTPSGTRAWETTEGSASLLLPDDPGAMFDLVVKARGYASATLQQQASANLPDDWSLQLEALPGIRGHVIAAGVGVAGAKVRLHVKWSDGRVKVIGNEVQCLSAAIDETETNETGAFQLFHAGDGEFVVKVQARRFTDAALDLGARTSTEVTPDIEIALDRGGELRGVVRDHLGQPVAGVALVLAHPHHKLKRKRSGRDGSFRFRKIPTGEWFLRTVSDFEEGFIGRTVEVEEGWTYPVNCVIVDGEETHLDLEMSDPANSSISGVWNGAGSPGDGWSLEVSCGGWASDGTDPFLEEWESKTDLNSGEAFQIPVQAGRGYRILIESLHSGGYLRRDIGAEELPLRITHEFEFAELEAIPQGWKPAAGYDGKLNIRWEQGQWSFQQSIEPDAQGRYPRTEVPAGELHLSWKNSTTLEWASMDVTLAVGEVRAAQLR